MPDDVEEHVAVAFHGLVSDLQHNDMARFEEEQKKQAQLRLLLRRQTPHQGLTAGELLKKLDGDPAEAQAKMQDDLSRIEREAKAAAAEKDKQNEPLPQGYFPPPPASE